MDKYVGLDELGLEEGWMDEYVGLDELEWIWGGWMNIELPKAVN